jgi:PilZ domain-containing protein
MQLFESVSRWLSDMPVVRRARNGRRVEVNQQVSIRAAGDDAINVALMRDLSIGGACIRGDLQLSQGDMIWIRAFDTSDDAIEFTATVASVRPNELGFFSDYGLRIVQLSVSSAGVLAEYINRRLSATESTHRDTIPR